jgi:hypothetical protein
VIEAPSLSANLLYSGTKRSYKATMRPNRAWSAGAAEQPRAPVGAREADVRADRVGLCRRRTVRVVIFTVEKVTK